MARAVSAAVLSSAIAAPALSQSLEEVIVTATKRSESIQDVPLAITALSGEFVNKVNLDDVKDLVSFTPGVTGNSQDSFIDAISVRGIRTQDFGVGGDPSTAFFKNDLYEGRNGSAVTSLYDIDRAEILRGPQGFLFGRSSIGGAFSVHTKRAEVGGGNSGYVDLDVGERDRLAVEGAVNLPLTDHMATRLAGYYSEEDGFAKNFYPGSDDLIEHEKWALRWSTTYERDRLGVYGTVEYEEREQSGSVYRAIDKGDIWDAFNENLGGVELRGSDEDIDSDQFAGDNDDADILTLGLRIEYDFDFATLTSNTGYKDHDYFYMEDYDGTPLNINNYGQDQEGDYFQQELRLTSNSEGPLNWYAGASYYKEDIDVVFNSIGAEDYFCQYYGNYYYPGNDFSGCQDLYDYYEYDFTPNPEGLLHESGRVKGEYEGWATYVNLDYYITKNLDLEIGVRYTEDEKDFSTNVPTPDSDLGAYWFYGFSTAEPLRKKESWDDTTWRGLLKWSISDDAMLFASYTQGYKSGGFGSFSVVDANGVAPDFGTTDLSREDGYLPDTFEPETADSYEIGYKDTLFNGSTNIDLTAFYYEYEDLQILYYDGGASLVDNVGEVEAWGVEGSVTAALNDNFTLYMAAGYLDSEANKLQIICGSDECEGSPLFWAPEWSAAFMLDAYFPMGNGAITGSLEAFYEDEKGGDWTGIPENYIDAFTEVAARIGYTSNNGWHIEAYVENLTDEFTWDGQNANGGVLPSHFFGPKRPRTFGMRVGMTWE
ncbi:TonB-dependent receptor [Seongchinamella unica]|uniref:TonB-dependent receptor n=1 Tax=Seongchinamella unica TaxID=2547392 RepID=A0A4V2ZXL1_9GAMM|nr:TonB-dependent receptor [Seongchinamella unica]TDG15435.1 TonB-dependent receptor [Seongchinamella unica]